MPSSFTNHLLSPGLHCRSSTMVSKDLKEKKHHDEPCHPAILLANPHSVPATYGQCMSILCDVPGWMVDDVPMPARSDQAKWGHFPSPWPPQRAWCPHLAGIGKWTLSSKEGPPAPMLSSGTWAELSIEYLAMPVSLLVTEILPPEEWVYTPLQPLFWPQACRREFNYLPPRAWCQSWALSTELELSFQMATRASF